MSESPLIARIRRELSGLSLLEALEERLPASDLQSLLLHVFQRRSAKRTAAELIAHYERSALVQPSTVDIRAMVEVERIAFDSAKDFEAIDLSPIAPLALNAVLGQIDQNNCLATVRGVEVLADPTTAAALECARRRRQGARDEIRVCSRSRVLRLQPFNVPGFTPHFELFSWVTAGRDQGSHSFEMKSLREHLAAQLDLLGRLLSLGYEFGDLRVEVGDTERDERRMQQVVREVMEPLSVLYPQVSFALDREREHARHYYSGLCLHIDARRDAGQWVNLSDGGFTLWTQRLLSNRKERLMVSAIGLELVVKAFRRTHVSGL
jgi:hypothetical protein